MHLACTFLASFSSAMGFAIGATAVFRATAGTSAAAAGSASAAAAFFSFLSFLSFFGSVPMLSAVRGDCWPRLGAEGPEPVPGLRGSCFQADGVGPGRDGMLDGGFGVLCDSDGARGREKSRLYRAKVLPGQVALFQGLHDPPCRSPGRRVLRMEHCTPLPAILLLH
jgi:hypothetical protein